VTPAFEGAVCVETRVSSATNPSSELKNHFSLIRKALRKKQPFSSTARPKAKTHPQSRSGFCERSLQVFSRPFQTAERGMQSERQ
jgi:hypothetical protein